MTWARKRRPLRRRIGKVSYYEHHGGWWIYYRDGQKQVRRRLAEDEPTAAAIAAQVNAQVMANAPTPPGRTSNRGQGERPGDGQPPTPFSFTPVSLPDLRERFLEHHEHVLRSSMATVSRYRAATAHLERFARSLSGKPSAHEISVADFVRNLRRLKVAPNGHPHAVRCPLRDKGIRYVLEVCRSLYAFAAKTRRLPPDTENPFSELGAT